MNIGVDAKERQKRQRVLVTIDIDLDIEQGAQSDNIRDTIDYDALTKKIIKETRSKQFHLLETLAECIAAMVMEDKRAMLVTVRVEKPNALQNAQSVGVTRIIRR